jgi:hypothetical protein|tara:strand:- start:145 stop:600 length:456 start_codon:yes stop_codon:yes gene_type:complete
MDINLIIRKAEKKDRKRVIEMAKNFYSVAGYDPHIPFDDETACELFECCMNMGLCYVAEEDEVVGFVLGVAAPSIMNKNYLIGSELAWWVEPEHRGKVGIKLLKHIEQSAEEIGLKIWSMMALESQNPESVEKIYLNSGYKKTETTYSRFN